METVLDAFFSSSSSSETESDISDDESKGGRRPKIKGFVPNVVDKYSDEEFKENFRMNKTTFEHLLTIVKDDISTSLVAIGHPSLNAKSQLLLTLWYFATPDSYRSICGRFNVGKATGQRTVRRVTKALLKLCSSIIHWPNADDLNEIKNEFNRKGFPNTLGCIDGSYIPIPTPKEHGLAYICRKNFPCVILQGVCDHKMKFIHCYVGEVGSVHDATVLKRSEMWQYLTTNEIEKFPENTHLLGDKAYPLLPTLMTPYKDNGHLTNEQRNFNYVHSTCRSTIERAFALLKGRFRILKYMDVKDVKWAVKYIMACCVLHNICILNNDFFDINVECEINAGDGHIEVRRDVGRERYARATAKRNAICRQVNL